MEKIAKKERFDAIINKTPVGTNDLIEPNREFPTIDQLKSELVDFEEEELFDDPSPELGKFTVWTRQEISDLKLEKAGVNLDSQMIVDEIAKAIALSKTSGQESKAQLNVQIAGEVIMVEIVKRRNRTKVRFTTEDCDVKRLLRNSKIELLEAATHAGLNFDRVEIR